MNKLKDYLTEILGGAGTLLGIVAMCMTPEQVVALLGLSGPGAMVVAIGVLTYIRGVYARRQKEVAQPPVEPPSTVKAHWLATVVGLIVTGLAILALTGCKTAPTQSQRIGIEASVAAAVAIGVQRDSSDPAVWAKRARLVVSVADAVRPLATDEAVSLPAIASAVGAELDKAKLDPAERIAANSFVLALSRLIDANTDPASPVVVTVRMVIEAARANALVYVPLEADGQPATIF